MASCPPTIGLVFAALVICPKIGVVKAEDALRAQNWGMLFQIGMFRLCRSLSQIPV